MQQVQPELEEEGIPITLNVYDVTNAASDTTNTTIVRFNNVARSLGVGGVFHGAVVIGSYELSFGFCENGTGVYSCPAGKNPMYTFRESIDLGNTQKSKAEIKEILHVLRQQWPGRSYDLLSRNCCHFCDALCKELGVNPTPVWLNRLATNAESTINFTNQAVSTAKGIGSELQRVTNDSITYLRSSWHRTFAPASVPPSGTAGIPSDAVQLATPRTVPSDAVQLATASPSASPRPSGSGSGSIGPSWGSRLVSNTKAMFKGFDLGCGPDSVLASIAPSSAPAHARMPGSKQPNTAHSEQPVALGAEHSLLIPKQPKLGAAAGDDTTDNASGGTPSAGGRLDADDEVAFGAPTGHSSEPELQTLGLRQAAMAPGAAPSTGVRLATAQR